MADYFLKATDGTRAYRLTYQVQDSSGAIEILGANAVGVPGAKTPSGAPIAELDQEASVSDVLVELVLGSVTPAAAADYRTVAKAQVDAKW